MSRAERGVRPLSLTTQLTTVLLALAVGSTLLFGTLAYREFRRSTRAAALRAVQATAAERAEALQIRLGARRNRARSFLEATRGTCADPGPECEGALELFRRTEGFGGALLLRPGAAPLAVGATVASLAASPRPARGELARFTAGPSGSWFYTVVAADRSNGATLLLRYDDLGPVAELFLQRGGLGSTGETFLADPRGVAITPLRFPLHGGGQDPIAAVPMRRCLASADGGEMLAPDYNKRDVVHAFRRVPAIGGGCIMAHVGEREAFAPVRNLGAQILGFGAPLALLALLASVAVARTITRPISRLSDAAGALREGRWDHPLPEGGPREIRAFASTFASMAASLRDRTREAEARAAEMARVADSLRRSNEDLDQFAYAAAHDLRTPLRGIASLATWIEEDLGDAAAPAAEHLRLLRERTHRMQALLADLLRYARTGRGAERAETVDVNALVRRLADRGDPAAATRWELAELPTIGTAVEPLEQVFTELLKNAVRHGSAGAAAIVRVSARREGEGWEFAVSDNGPGIAAAYRDKVFGIFETLRPADVGAGAGMGLPLARKIVELHGGRLWLEAAEGEGATFRFTWPAVAEEAHP